MAAQHRVASSIAGSSHSLQMGISTMLNRLKQSIASAKEFALFLKRRALLEDEHAQGLRKLCRMSQDSIHRTEHRGGSFAKAYEDMMAIHERMAENGMQFSTSLMQMHEDLVELAAMAEKSRKGWKQSGLAAETRVVDMETAMRKSKSKYDSLAEEYERVRTGDIGGAKGKVFGIRGPKSAEQHEQDLLRKVQTADQDYYGKVQTYQTERGELLNRIRPETVKALQDIVRECDSGMVLQMQKFASFNEKLLLSNGLTISPLKGQPGEARSLRECIAAIDNDRDLNDFLSSYHKHLPPKSAEPKYERNRVLDTQQPISPTGPPPGQGSFQSMSQPMSQPPSMSRAGPGNYAESPTSPQGPPGHGYHPSSGSISMIPGAQRPGSQPQLERHERSFSIGSLTSRHNNNPQPSQQFQPRNSLGPQQPVPSSRFNGPSNTFSSSQGSGGPPQLGALPFQPSAGPPPLQPQPPPPQQQQPPPQFQQQQQQQQPPHPQPLVPGGPVNPLQQNPSGPNQQGPGMPRPGYAPARQQTPPRTEPPARPVFRVTLSELYERDQLAVPMVVYQCIQAVDLYGLGVEGIYRLSGSLPHVNKLKAMFDHDSSSPSLDFRNPENFFHDVNSVAGLLKQFFRDLPDPLLTREHYHSFIEAAKNDDEVLRRDSLHAIINDLPDPNYATLRALTLHLHRVIENSAVNRMSTQNLAIVFGPTLMGTDSNLADSGFQSKVVETILQNTYQIFDDD
ncbi:RhoGAP-domain-containing protein [Coniochaeta ligniaria NRRL 30616]|uniref:RhoGAP-domain-containing protein n=1 Tax=Coniochaeta ligniaria NRRL 30616 TaxID=1408157 RepID=A0A1J7JNT9_9PEZI|nr:RhoGAP-domain-containing protein [Coniochaeta ligniaria NRRL 30616]